MLRRKAGTQGGFEGPLAVKRVECRHPHSRLAFPYWHGADVDECASAPCQNGGQCIHGKGLPFYACLCQQGYWGNECQLGRRHVKWHADMPFRTETGRPYNSANARPCPLWLIHCHPHFAPAQSATSVGAARAKMVAPATTWSTCSHARALRATLANSARLVRNHCFSPPLALSRMPGVPHHAR